MFCLIFFIVVFSLIGNCYMDTSKEGFDSFSNKSQVSKSLSLVV